MGRRSTIILLATTLLGAAPARASDSESLPSLGRAGGGAIALSDEYQLGLQIMREIRRQGALFDDPLLRDYLQGIGHRLSSNSEDPELPFYFFPVRDGNRRHVVAEWGGTLFNFGPIRPRLQAYAASAERFKQLAAKAGADVILSNHTVYDGSKTKLPAVQARQAGQPHPYVVGPQVVQRYLTTVGECAQAAVAGLPAN